MRKLSIGVVIVAALVVAVAWSGFVLLTASTGGCAAALLQGTLVRRGTTLGVEPVPKAPPMSVSWPIGYGVRDDAGTLVLTRFLVTDIAREGDAVSVGGGMSNDDSVFLACGPVTLGLMLPTP